jgi:protein SCO1/2
MVKSIAEFGSITAVLLLATFLCVPASAFNTGKPLTPAGSARPATQSPADLEEVDVVENLDAMLPLDLTFRDEQGATVRLGSLFEEGKPVIVTLGYYECPMLCSLVLNGMVNGLKDMDLRIGDDFKVLTLSIDPEEGYALAVDKKKSYLKSYDETTDPAGWRFLTGDQEPITALADALGFRYKYIPENDQFAHAAVIMVVTPEGRISRYLYGVQYEPKTVRLSLVEAGQGKVGTTMDRFLLTCYSFDASAGTYSLAAMKLMRLGGLLTLAVVVLFLGFFWLRESRRNRTAVKEVRT